MINDIVNQIIECLKGVYLSRREKNAVRFTEYVDEVYSNVEVVYKDFSEILFTARNSLEDGESIVSVIRYLEKSRIKFKTTRDKIRAKLDLDYYQDTEFLYFYIYICGVLQGGMTECVEDRIKKEIGPNENVSMLKSASKEHTLVDLIDRYKDIFDKDVTDQYISDITVKNIWLPGNKVKNVLIRNSCPSMNSNNELYDKLYKERLLEDIKKQIYSIDEYWVKLSNVYAKLKKQEIK